MIEHLSHPLASAFSHGDATLQQITVDGLSIFTLSFHVFGSSYEAAFYGVWYSVVFSELLATLMTLWFLKRYQKKYQYA